MQINVSYIDNPMALDYMFYQDNAPELQNYFQSQAQSFGPTLTDIGKRFMEQSKELYDITNNSYAVRAAKAAIRNAGGIFHHDSICKLNTLETIQRAQPIMQRWIMAEPTVRSIYHDNRCDGFFGEYQDIEPDKIGDTHYDYRRVMDTMVSFEEDGSWVAKQYYDELLPTDNELSFHEKCDIISTWDIMKFFLESGEDVTCAEGGKIS
jgi:hypothetical protein